MIDSCLTLTFPTHLSHWSQTLWAILHVVNKCCPDSSHSWHSGQAKSVNYIPLLAKLSFVGSLSNSNLQAQTAADRTILRVYNNWKISDTCIWSSLFSTLYPDLAVYSWLLSLSLTHTSLSWSLKCQRTLEIIASSSSSSSFSQTNLSLRQSKHHLEHPSLAMLPTTLSKHWGIVNNLGNLSFKT